VLRRIEPHRKLKSYEEKKKGSQVFPVYLTDIVGNFIYSHFVKEKDRL